MDGKRGWLVVLGSFLTLIFTAGVSFFVLPVLLGPIGEDTGWTLTQISLGVTLWGVSAAILSPFCGMVIDRFGARNSILFGITYTALGTFLVSRVTNLTQFYIVMFCIPFGPMLSTYIPVGTLIPRWFVKHRGAATGLAMLGIGIGGATFPLIAGALLKSNDWRGTYSILSGLLLIAWIPAFFLIRNPTPEEELPSESESESPSAPPSDSPEHSANDSSNESAGEPERAITDHLTLSQALRTRSFWCLGLGDSLTGVVYAIFNVQLVVLLTSDLGDRDTATKILSVFLLFTGLATLPIGALGDRLPFRLVFVACYLVPALGVFFLFPGEQALLAFAFALIAGSAAGGRTALYPIALARSFGELHIAPIWGLSNSMFMIGTAAGPVVGSLLFDKAGGTRSVYIFCIVTLLISGSIVSLIRREKKPAAS